MDLKIKNLVVGGGEALVLLHHCHLAVSNPYFSCKQELYVQYSTY